MSRRNNPRTRSLHCRGYDIHRIGEKELRNVFSAYGKVVDVYLPKDYFTKRLRGFAYIQFEDEDEADAARLKLDRTDIFSDNRPVSIMWAAGERKTPGDMRRLDVERDNPHARRERERPRRSDRDRDRDRYPRRYSPPRYDRRRDDRDRDMNYDRERDYRKRARSRTPSPDRDRFQRRRRRYSRSPRSRTPPRSRSPVPKGRRISSPGRNNDRHSNDARRSQSPLPLPPHDRPDPFDNWGNDAGNAPPPRGPDGRDMPIQDNRSHQRDSPLERDERNRERGRSREREEFGDRPNGSRDARDDSRDRIPRGHDHDDHDDRRYNDGPSDSRDRRGHSSPLETTPASHESR